MPTPDPPDQRAHSDAMDIDQPKKHDAEAMDIDKPRKRDADSMFVHEDAEDEDGHGSKRQKQDGDGLDASRSRDETPSQGPNSSNGSVPQDATPSQVHNNVPGSRPHGTTSSKPSSTKVPGLRQWKGIQRPALAIFHPAFKRAQDGISEACDIFYGSYGVLQGKGYVNEEIERIVDQKVAKSRSPLSKFPNIGPVVLLGPAGAGKSSGLNCYLDKRAAAVESDSGKRGTNTVHEYSAAEPDQTSEYRVVARYGTWSMIKADVRAHCHAIYQYRNRQISEIDEDDEEDLKARHDTAMNFFTTLLGSREEFDIVAGEPNYFDRRTDADGKGAEKAAAAELYGLIKELLHSKGIPENEMRLSRDAHNEDELNSIFFELSGNAVRSEKTRKAISTWPLIVKIEVHLEHDLLDCGLTIADAPGVTDTDPTVVRKTTNYLRGAGTILVFTTPDRVATNPQVAENLRACIDLDKMHATYLVVTKIDEKSPLTQNELSALSADKRIEFQAAEDSIQALETKAEELAKAFDQLDEEEGTALKANMAQTKKVDIQIAQAKAKMQQLAIETRNTDIECAMKNKLRELSRKPNAPDLKIIFTSNRVYQKHLRGYDQKDPPMLDLQATGIPAIQNILYNVLASGRVNTIRRIGDTLLPSAFNGMIGTLTHSPLKRKSEVSTLISTLFEEKQARIMAQMIHEVKQKWQEHIKDPMNPNSSKRNRATQALVQDWSTYNHSNFAAFCRRAGVWRRERGEPLINWNSGIQEIYAADLSGGFNVFDSALDNIQNGALNSINEQYQLLEKKLEACEAFQGADDKPFYEQIRYHGRHVVDSVAQEGAKFKANINSIRNTATLATENTCVISIMEETYKECAAKRGNGVHAARVTEMRNKLMDNGGGTGIFEAVYQELFQQFQRAVGRHEIKVTASLEEGSGSVLQDFGSRFQADEFKHEEDPEAKEILENAIQRTLDRLREVMRDLEEAVAYENANAASA